MSPMYKEPNHNLPRHEEIFVLNTQKIIVIL